MFTIKLDQFEREYNPNTEISNLELVAVLAIVFNIEPYEIEVYTLYGGNIVFKYDSGYLDVLELVAKDALSDPSHAFYRNADMRSILKHQLAIANMIEKEYAAHDKAGFVENVTQL